MQILWVAEINQEFLFEDNILSSLNILVDRQDFKITFGVFC